MTKTSGFRVQAAGEGLNRSFLGALGQLFGRVSGNSG